MEEWVTSQNQKSKIKNQKSNNPQGSPRSLKPTNPSASSGSSTMAELLASQKSAFVAPQKGKVIKGIITKLTPSEILVDINAKSEAVVLEKDKRLLRTLLNKLKVGDSVEVSVLNPESEFGNPVVSLRRFMGNIIWDQLLKYQKNKEPLLALVKESTRGGYLVDAQMGISGFLPNSQLVLTSQNYTDQTSPQQFLSGKQIKVYVLELNRENRKVIFSQKPVLDIKDFEEKTKLLKIGQKMSLIVSNITPFGIFVNLPDIQLDGLIHISEISWGKTENIQEQFALGQTVEAEIIGIDLTAKRVDLSIKRLTPNPFEEKLKKYSLDQKVNATVSKIISTGILVDLGDEISGIIRKEKIPPTVTYEKGQEISATVSEIDTRRQRIILVPVLKEKPIGYR